MSVEFRRKYKEIREEHTIEVNKNLHLIITHFVCGSQNNYWWKVYYKELIPYYSDYDDVKYLEKTLISGNADTFNDAKKQAFDRALWYFNCLKNIGINEERDLATREKEIMEYKEDLLKY